MRLRAALDVKRVLATAVVLIVAAPLWGQEHANCPMAPAAEHRAGVDHRHDQATGVAHENAVHHFELAPDGGSIRLEVMDTSQLEVRDRIREHLQVVARAFAAGDFTLPMQIHDQVPPGVEVMKRRKAAVRYAFSPNDKGGVVRISTKDQEALSAVHAFLRFQIEDHGTGDPTE